MLTTSNERYVTKQQACFILLISPAQFDRWRKKPGFPKNHNPGGRCRFWLPDLMNWMANR